MKGYKVLLKNGESRYGEVRYPLPSGGKPGAWVDVPGDGTYVSECGIGIVDWGGGPLLVEMEVKYPTKARNLPDGLKCYRRVRVLRKVHTLPLPKSIHGDLKLGGCTWLTSLPKGLTVGENLDLAGCTGLRALPDGLSVGGNLDLTGCTGLTSLPDRLSVGGQICVLRCKGLGIGHHRTWDGWLGLEQAREAIVAFRERREREARDIREYRKAKARGDFKVPRICPRCGR